MSRITIRDRLPPLISSFQRRLESRRGGEGQDHRPTGEEPRFGAAFPVLCGPITTMMNPVTSVNLSRNLVILTRALRASGIAVDPDQGIDLQRAVERIDCTDSRQFYLAARAIFVRRLEDIAIFDRAYAYFWRDLGRLNIIPSPSVIGGDDSEDFPLQQQDEAFHQQLDASNPIVDPTSTRLDAGPIEHLDDEDGREIPPTEEPIPIRTYSRSETLRHQSFEHFTHSELEAAREILRRMRWQVGSRALRRMRIGSHGRHLDMRSMVQRSLRSAGEFTSLAWRIPKTKPRPLVILGDISGSMERYTRLLIQFFYASRRGRKDVEIFTFGTRLTRITRDLEYRNIDESLGRVAAHVVDWSGGTRIGSALKTFNRTWARRVLGRGCVTIVVSDGWDRGDIDLLRLEMSKLQLRSFRLIWANPLLGFEGYEPLTAGMQAALPFIDDFVPANNVASLADLAGRLSLLENRRPIRRYQPLVRQS